MKTHIPFNKKILALSIAHVLCGTSGLAVAGTITVNSTADAVVADGNCTLREAVQAANTDAAVDSCAAGSGTDTIEFDNTLAGSTITLGGSEIDLSSTLTIDGDINNDGSPDITVDGNNTSSVFQLDTEGIETTLEGLVIQNGNAAGTTGWAGGGVVVGPAFGSYVDMQLNITNSTLQGNSADYGGGVYSNGNLTINNSTLTNNTALYRGGGVYSQGTIIISGATFSANQALGDFSGRGGAAIKTGSGIPSTLTVSNSTFDGNSSARDAGAIMIDNDTTSAVISNSTFTNNHADNIGGAVMIEWTALAQPVDIINCTFSGNSASVQAGALYSGASSTNLTSIIHSTFTENTAPTYSNIYIQSPVEFINSIMANHINGDCHATGTVSMTNTLVEDGGTACGTPSLSVDPELGPLQDNGGPTLTHLPADTSPVIDAGNNTDCGEGLSVTTDQRGKTRDDGACDIGAVEVKPAVNQSVIVGGISTFLLYSLLALITLARRIKRLVR